MDHTNGQPTWGLAIRESLRKVFRAGNPPRPPSQVFSRAKIHRRKESALKKAETNGSQESLPEKPEKAVPGLHLEPDLAGPSESSPEVDPTRGLTNECKTLDCKQGRRQVRVLSESNDPYDTSSTGSKSTNFEEYCLVVTRHFSDVNIYQRTSLTIQSPLLIKALQSMVKHYPDCPVDVGNSIIINQRPDLLYHFQDELREYANASTTDAQTKLHIEYALTYLEIQIGPMMDECANYLAQGLIHFKHLWTIFRSDSLVYEPSTDQVYYFSHAGENVTNFTARCKTISYRDGKTGGEDACIHIKAFDTAKAITSLPVYPLKFHRDPVGLKARLIKRGERFLQLRGMQYQNHLTKGRVMIDGQKWETCGVVQSTVDAGFPTTKCVCSCTTCLYRPFADHRFDPQRLTDDDLLLCSATVYGFSFSERRWGEFRIDELGPMVWDKECINSVVMDNDQKKVLLSLVTSPIFLEGKSNGMIQSKGNGLIVLLHGPPGTGKTLTAECVGQCLERPLYMVSAGELGTDPERLDKTLSDILDLCARWKAIVLIDEADVFLEARTDNDLHRNSLVSVFLRNLEYFTGMIFLTTNRVARFDTAFTSRIHLALNYPDFTIAMRRDLWINSLKQFPQAELDIDLDGAVAELAPLSDIALNGRVIAYAVRTAKALAEADNEKLGVTHLRKVIKMYEKFCTDLGQPGTGKLIE